jgi:hypothetical protein
MFGVKGKFSKYNIHFNNLDMYNNDSLLTTFKQYAVQDSMALFEALKKAQNIYLTD